MPIFINGMLLLTVLADGLLIAFVCYRHTHDALTTLLCIHLFFILIWALSLWYLLFSGSMLASQLGFASALIMAVAKYYFIRLFPHNELPGNISFYLPLLPAAIILVGVFVDNWYVTSFTIVDQSYIMGTDGPYAVWYMLTVSYFMMHPIVLLGYRLKKKLYDKHTAAQARLLLFGIAVFFVAALLTNSILPVAFDFYYLNGTGPSFSLILAALIVYTIYKYNFLQIRVLIQRGVVFTLTLGCIIAIYLALIELLSIGLQLAVSISAIIAGGITTVIGIFAAPYGIAYFKKITHSIFFKDDYNYSEILYSLSENLGRLLKREEIITYTTEQLKTTFGSSRAVIVTDHVEGKERLDDGVGFPLKTKNGSQGELILGAKRSGDPYTKTDLQLIRTLAHQVAVALERAELYEEVRSYTEHLEEMVTERTHEIKELQQYQKQMMDEISHSLQTPLTVIGNELENLKLEQKHNVEVNSFRKSITSLTDFVAKLLHLSRLEAKVKDPSHQSLNLSELVKDTAEYCVISLTDNNVSIHTAIEPNVSIMGNRKELEEVLIILIHNAVKYRNPERPQVITITLTTEKEVARLAVHDVGIGISEKALPNIFKRFYRVREAGRQTSGTGLGLAITKVVVQKHNGEITATSQKNHYTEFTITLPRVI